MQRIIHIELKGDSQKKPKHFYFGSMSVAFNQFSPEELGITYGTLRRKTPNELGVLFENDRCIIRKGVLVVHQRKRKEEE